MSETAEALQRKINSARELKSVVRTMKSLAALSIGQYERAVRSLADYCRAVELGLAACLREEATVHTWANPEKPLTDALIAAIVFGSDQGLVGQFNDHLARFALSELNQRSGSKAIWAVGERIYAKLQDAGLPPRRRYAVPNSIAAITPLISQILVDHETLRANTEVYIFHNQPRSGASYEPVKQRLLPLDQEWQRALSRIKWPTKMLPQVVGDGKAMVFALIHEYLFVSLFKACAESLTSENASRLAAMQRAQRNIDDLLEVLQTAFHQKRQTSIDAELFDVISGFEVLADQHMVALRESLVGPSANRGA
jgi:F-type H+-transporting ATPase subunit gamma